MPVWATENISDVTTYLATNSTDFHDPYAEILTGTEESGTHLHSKLVVIKTIQLS